MIDIRDISFGWTVLQIGYCVFNASYFGFICPDNDEEYREAMSIYEGRKGE